MEFHDQAFDRQVTKRSSIQGPEIVRGWTCVIGDDDQIMMQDGMDIHTYMPINPEYIFSDEQLY